MPSRQHFSAGRWPSDLAGDLLASSAARKILRLRLRAVVHYFPRAALHSDRDVELVHQLRVASRHAHAALRVFHELLPARRTRRLAKILRKIRRDSGQARDLDVLLAQLQREPLPEHVRQPLLAFARKKRLAAQRPLCHRFQKLGLRRFMRIVRHVCQRTRWRRDSPEPTYTDFLHSALKPTIDEFLRRAEGPLKTADELHQLRIAGKQLRYSLELLGPLLTTTVRNTLLPPLKQLQQRLGEINDHHFIGIFWDEFAQTSAADTPQIAELIRHSQFLAQKAAERKTELFRHWWTIANHDSVFHRQLQSWK